MVGGEGSELPDLRMRRWTLRFCDPVLDADFRAAHDRKTLENAPMAGCLAILLYGAFAWLDTVVVPGDLTGLFVVRFVVVIPVIAGTVVWAVLARPVRLVQPAICFIVVFAAAGMDLMAFLAEVPEDYVRTGTLLVLMFLYALARVRFVWTIGTTVIVVGAYVIGDALRGTSLETAVYNLFFLASFIVIGASAAYMLERLRREEFVRELELAHERARSDRLLHQVLPQEIAARLRDRPGTIAEGAESVSVVFADVVGFTPLSDTLPPAQVVALLDRLFSAFDEVCGRHGLEKIKTIGDAYMAVAGLPHADPDHAASAAEMALDLRAQARRLAGEWPVPLQLRIGIASGPVIAGVIGRRKFAYDLWGDTVNTASRMESQGIAGEIQLAPQTRSLLEGRYVLTDPEPCHVKGKGTMMTSLLVGRAAAAGDRAVTSGVGGVA